MNGLAALLVMLCGFVAFAYGLWMIFPPLAWLFIGAVLLVIGVGIVRQDQRKAAK